MGPRTKLIHEYFHTQMKTRSQQLRSELRLLTKGTRSIAYFIARVRVVIDTLMSIDDPVLHHDHIELVLEALQNEFDSVVDAINSRYQFISLDILESLLHTQEAHNENTQKEVTESLSINLAQGSS